MTDLNLDDNTKSRSDDVRDGEDIEPNRNIALAQSEDVFVQRGGSDVVPEALLAILVCPLTRTELVYDRDNNELISRAARLAFPVRNGIPVMLEGEARCLGEHEQ